MKQCRTLLDYCATYPNVFLRYNASDMILNIDSDAAYLVAPKARSRIAGYFQLNSNFRSPPTTNGAILLECKTLRHVVASSAEAETAGLFHNAQVAIPIRYILTEMGHPQPATPIKTDNVTANAFVHANITQRKSKSWTCVTTGFERRINKKSLAFTGIAATPTTPTTILSITRSFITEQPAIDMSMINDHS